MFVFHVLDFTIQTMTLSLLLAEVYMENLGWHILQAVMNGNERYVVHSVYLSRLNNTEVNGIKYIRLLTLLLLSSSKEITESIRGKSGPSSCTSSIISLDFPDKVFPRTNVFLNFYAPSGWCSCLM